MTLRYALGAAVFVFLIGCYLIWLAWATEQSIPKPAPGTLGHEISCYEGECG